MPYSKHTDNIMNMPITVEVVDVAAKPTDIEAVFEYFRQIDNQFSTFKKNSEISRINRGELHIENATPEMQKAMTAAALSVPGVLHVIRVRTMILGNENILANLDVNFKDNLRTDDIEQTIIHMKSAIQKSFPEQTIQVNIDPVSASY